MTAQAPAEAYPRGGLRWTLFGRLSMTAANGLLMLGCALFFMDEETFGLFAAVVGAQLLASRAVLCGLDQGVVRLFTADREPDAVVRGAVAITLTLGAIGLGLAGIIAAVGGVGRLTPTLALAIGAGAAGTAWFDLGCSALLARLEFRRAGLWMAAMPTARALVTGLTAATTAKASWAPFVAFPAVSLLSGITLLALVVRQHGLTASRAVVGRVFTYSWWIGLGDAAAVLALQSGLFLLVFRDMTAEAGRFAFSLQIVQGFYAVFVAFYQALLPKAARLPGAHALPAWLRAAWRTSLLLATGCVLAAALAGNVMPTLIQDARPDLADFAPGFYGLTAFSVVLMFEAPLGVSCQYLLRPGLHVASLWLRCACIGLLGLFTIPALGEFGAGLAQTGGTLAAGVVLLVLVHATIARQRREEQPACAAS
ncbi:MAG: lipopolysaccharide biosynthesis protein [Planctomycetota bacterium]